MNTAFEQLNHGWNAEPNAPEPRVEVVGTELRLHFLLNSFQFDAFSEDDTATLRFADCWRYRLGGTNDEGWYSGRCRFSGLAPSWGEFYEVRGDLRISAAPADWHQLAPQPSQSRHFLFYLRDHTFECDAASWAIVLPKGAA
jgi:hypothetical protein